MGMRARLGLGIGRDLKQHMNKTVSFTRNRCTKAAAASEKKEEEEWLYLYFKERTVYDYKGHRTRFPIRSVKLSYLLSASPPTKINMGDNPTISDQFVPNLRETDRCRNWAQFSNHLLFTAPGVQGSHPSKTCSLGNNKANNFPVVKSIQRYEHDLLYLEGELPADGTLYSLSGDAFEVFDTKSSKWLSLETSPPRFFSNPQVRFSFRSVVIGTKVLVWYPKKPEVCCFDVTQPEKGWSYSTSLEDRVPFIDRFSPLVIQHDNNDYLLFNFDPKATKPSVQAFLFSSHPYLTLQPLEHSLQFPEVPPNYWIEGDSHLVHLGGKKICLVLHRFDYALDYDDIPEFPGRDDMSLRQLDEICYRGRNKGHLILITFEYEIDFESFDIEYRILTTHRLKYTGQQDGQDRILAMLSGASVL